MTSANAPSLLPGVYASAAVITDVQNQLAHGRTMMTPMTELTLQNWTGTGYISIDPTTEEGGYFLSGIVSGGQTIVSPVAPIPAGGWYRRRLKATQAADSDEGRSGRKDHRGARGLSPDPSQWLSLSGAAKRSSRRKAGWLPGVVCVRGRIRAEDAVECRA